MTSTLLKLPAALILCGALTGCGAVIAGTAGGLIVDEGINENDGQFDPLERTEAGQAFQRAID